MSFLCDSTNYFINYNHVSPALRFLLALTFFSAFILFLTIVITGTRDKLKATEILDGIYSYILKACTHFTTV